MFLPRKTLIATAATLLALWSHSPTAWAQAKGDPELSDQERAKRDANKVFRFIKFHAVRPPAATAATPSAAGGGTTPAPTKVVERVERVEPKAAPSASSPDVQVAALEASKPAKAAEPADAAPISAPPPAQEPVAAPTSLPASPTNPAAPSVEPAPEPEPEADVVLQLISHVEPEVPTRYLSQLRSGSVMVRFMVGPEGKVVSASAREGAQRHLANAAVRAVQQWRFAPMPVAREAEVEIAFNLDAL
jgi:protein TonB